MIKFQKKVSSDICLNAYYTSFIFSFDNKIGSNSYVQILYLSNAIKFVLHVPTFLD